MDSNLIIDELKDELISQKGFLWNKKNKDSITKCVSLLDDLKASLPASIQEAGYIISQKQKILGGAQETANKILADANEKANALISQNRITKQAESQAETILENANKKCNQMFISTRDNIDKMLKSIEDYLTNNLSVVKGNREQIGTIFNNISKNKPQ